MVSPTFRSVLDGAATLGSCHTFKCFRDGRTHRLGPLRKPAIELRDEPLHPRRLLAWLGVLRPARSVLRQMPRVLSPLTGSTPMLQRARARESTGATQPCKSAPLVELTNPVSHLATIRSGPLCFGLMLPPLALKVVRADRHVLRPGHGGSLRREGDGNDNESHATSGSRRQLADRLYSPARLRRRDCSGTQRIHCVDLSALETAVCIGSGAREGRSPVLRCRCCAMRARPYSSLLSPSPSRGRNSRLSPRSR
jgi:hypothetical protein